MLNKLHVNVSISIALLFTTSVDPAGAGVNEWTSQGPAGGYVFALAIDPSTPSTIYAGTAFSGGGVYKSTDHGAHWTGVNTGLPGAGILALAIDPATPATVYCGTESGGVFKTTDGGESWYGGPVAPGSGRVTSLAIDPAVTATLYTGTDDGVYKTTDGGEHWTDASGGLGQVAIAALVIDPANPSILYAGTGHGVFKSIDGGGLWTAINTGLVSIGGHVPAIDALAIDPFDPATVYAGGPGVYKSTDGGGRWIEVNDGLRGEDMIPAVRTLALDPVTPATVYAGAVWGSGGVYKSTDGGGSWVAIDVGWFGVDAGLDDPDVRALAIDPADSSVLYAGTTDVLECAYYSAGLYKSADGGDSWAVSNTGLSSTSILALAIHPTTPSVLYAGIDSGGSAETTDGGATWSANGGDSSVTALAIDPSDPSIRYRAISDCTDLPGSVLIRIDDAGWKDISPDENPVVELIIDPLTPTTLYAVTRTSYGSSGAVYRSSDRGDTWTAITTGLPGSGTTVLGIDRSTPQILYAGTRDGVFKTIDGGDSWAAANSGGDTRIRALAVDPGMPSIVYAGTDDGILKSTDAGAGWFSAGLPDTLVSAIAIDPLQTAIVYAGTSDGVFKTKDGGEEWQSFNTGLQNARAHALVIDRHHPSKLYAATARGVFDVTQVEPCDGTALCLHQERFRVDLEWRSFDRTTGYGQVVPFRSDDSGLLWFFQSENWEMLIKVLDGCAINDRFWVFAAATTTVEYTLTVTDTQTGAIRDYFNPLGNAAAAITDTAAFDTCPAGPAGRRAGEDSTGINWLAPASDYRARLPADDSVLGGACVPSATGMCLRGRFKLEVTWRDHAGNVGPGRVIDAGTPESGMFWFFDPSNWEMLVKVLDGCDNFGGYLFIGAATTDVEYTLTITDTDTGAAWQEFNPLGTPSRALVRWLPACP